MEHQKKENQKKQYILHGTRDMRSLVDRHQHLIEIGEDPSLIQKLNEEKVLLSGMERTEKEFITNAEFAKGIHYQNKMPSTWIPPLKYRSKSEKWCTKIRERYNIEISGTQPYPPPITKFKHMRFPPAILKGLKSKSIKYPTPIQMQALPTVLSGRDCIGIAYTGSGKTLVFALPMIMFSLEEELKMSIVNGEGPIGIIICPSRELATQTYKTVLHFCEYLSKDGWPLLRTLLCMGGIDFHSQNEQCQQGIHMAVCTPGRLKDSLEKKKFSFNLLKYWCLDEADRLMDVGFEDDIRTILSFCEHQIQKVFFSATMPPKVRDLAYRSMVEPIVINIGRAGAANLDVIQEVEYVKDEAKIVYLLECLKKTPPPVLIFCSNQADVDNVHEYLLLKGVDAVAIHAGKEMVDRSRAIRMFQSSETDVLCATDVASKGLDFPDIRHVINYDMPKEIEDYIHRIGRTGRCGKTGVATTFININVPEITLFDLKGLLMEAQQKIPPILMSIGGNVGYAVINGMVGCAYCGGLGHRITMCPKFAASKKGKNRGFVDDGMMLAGY